MSDKVISDVPEYLTQDTLPFPDTVEDVNTMGPQVDGLVDEGYHTNYDSRAARNKGTSMSQSHTVKTSDTLFCSRSYSCADRYRSKRVSYIIRGLRWWTRDSGSRRKGACSSCTKPPSLGS